MRLGGLSRSSAVCTLQYSSIEFTREGEKEEMIVLVSLVLNVELGAGLC